LMQALNNYSGAVILVSHDTHLVECVADQLWLVADGKCKPYDDDLDAYRKLVIRQRRLEREKLKQDARAPKPQEGTKAPDAEQEALKLEQRIADLAQRKHMLEGDIAACFGEAHDAAHLKKLNAAHAALQKELDAAEAALALVIDRL